MEKRRTVAVKLNVYSDGSALLRDTIDELLWAAQYVTNHAFDGESVTTSKTTLHDETYGDVREDTRLHSNHVQAAQNKAADAAKSGLARWKQGKRRRNHDSGALTSSTTIARPPSTTST